MVVVWLVDSVFIGNCLKSVIGYGIYYKWGDSRLQYMC
jgi:hypothetical protein